MPLALRASRYVIVDPLVRLSAIVCIQATFMSLLNSIVGL